MKKILFALITTVIVLIVTFGNQWNVSAQTTFVVSNQQAEGLGQVTVTTPSGDNYLTVPGNSTDTASISGTAMSITINGQTVPQGQQALVTLPDATVVGVKWDSTSEVVVLDKDEIN